MLSFDTPTTKAAHAPPHSNQKPYFPQSLFNNHALPPTHPLPLQTPMPSSKSSPPSTRQSHNPSHPHSHSQTGTASPRLPITVITQNQPTPPQSQFVPTILSLAEEHKILRQDMQKSFEIDTPPRQMYAG
jgi:hypothetical protein